MKRAVAVSFAVVVVSLAGASPGVAVLAEQAVLATRVDEATPAAAWNDDETVEYLAFARNSRAHPRRFNAFLRTSDLDAGTSTTVRLNESGSGWIGGVDAGRVVYQQIVRGQSTIKLYDIEGATRANPPSGVNTALWEWGPSLSGDLLLFGRAKTTRPRRDKVLLFNLATSQTTTLASVDNLSLTPGQVSGNYATWDRCTTICNAFVHDTSTGKTTRLPRPDTTSPRHQYAPAPTPTGTVYVFRSRDACGAGVQLVRYGPDDGATGLVVASLPSGRDGWQTSVRPASDGSVDVFYRRVNCSSGMGDIYKVTDPG